MGILPGTAHSGADANDVDTGPSAALYLTEVIRGLASAGTFPLAVPWLAAAPRGDGHGVLVLPGLLANDPSTSVLRLYLRWLGYDVRGWGLGRNLGPTDAVVEGLPRLLTAHAEKTGRAVSVVGWSLGGIYGREIARAYPEYVRQVITLGSPFALTDPRQSRVNGVYQRGSKLHAAGVRLPTREEVARPIAVPSTAVYSRMDGIVSWRACIAPETALHRNVEVRCGHLGFGVDPATLWLVAERLAAPPGRALPFRPPPLMRPLYPGHR